MRFTHCYPKSTAKQLHPFLIRKLNALEEKLGYELDITSAFRTIAHEVANSRKGDSSHCFGLAVDIYCPTSRGRFHLLSAAIELGFKRLGVYKNYVHLDVANYVEGQFKSSDVIWYG